MARRASDDSVDILLNYESNLEDELKKDNAQIQKSKKLIEQNNRFLSERLTQEKKLTKVQQEAVAKAQKHNTLLERHIKGLEKRHSKTMMMVNLEKQATAELKKQSLIQDKQAAKADARSAKAFRRQRASQSFFGSFDPEFSTSFSHKLGTTLQYVAAGAGIMTVATAFKTLGEEVVNVDLKIRTMSAVLDLNLTQARELGNEMINLGSIYGGTIDEINNVALSLGRAGIASKDLVASTEVVLQMARLTGDTFEQSADAIISFQQVFGQTNTIEELGDKLAYVANVSRLSTKDIGTFANFALAAAKNVGLSVDAVGGLAAAFSNAGVNASTIGTQIRRFTSLLSDNAESVQRFFRGLGVTQGNLLARLQSDTETSNAAIIEFVHSLNELDDATFANLVGGMDILASNSLSLMRNNSDNITRFVTDTAKGVEGQLAKTSVILESFSVTIEKVWNNIVSDVERGVGSLFNSLDIRFGGDNAASQILRDQLRNLQKEREAAKGDIDKLLDIQLREDNAKRLAQANAKARAGDSTKTQEQLLADINKISKKLLENYNNTAVSQEQRNNREKAYITVLDTIAGKLDTVKEKQEKLITGTPVSISDLSTQATLLGTLGDSDKLTSKNLADFKSAAKAQVAVISTELDNVLLKNKANVLETFGGNALSQAVQLSSEINRLSSENTKLEKEGLDTNQEKIKDNNNLIRTYQQVRKELDKILEIDKLIEQLEKKKRDNEQARIEKAKKFSDELEKAQKSFEKAELANLNFGRNRLDILKEQDVELNRQLESVDKQVERLKLKAEIEKNSLAIKQAESQELARQLQLADQEAAIRERDYRGVGITRRQNIRNIQGAIDRQGIIAGSNGATVEQRQQALMRIKELTADLMEEQRKLNDEVGTGAVDALQKYANEASDVYGQINSVVTSSLTSMEDAFINFAQTGKVSFSDLANSILSDMLKIALRSQILGPLSNALVSGSFQFANGGTFSGGVQMFANGGAFTNSTVSKPTMFNMGMMGEAGPEAIVPLTRHSGGALGVKSTPSNVVLNITNNTGNDVQAEMVSEHLKTNERGEQERIISIVMSGVSKNVNGSRDMFKSLR